MIRLVGREGRKEEEAEKKEKRKGGRDCRSTATETATYCPAYRYSRYNSGCEGSRMRHVRSVEEKKKETINFLLTYA